MTKTGSNNLDMMEGLSRHWSGVASTDTAANDIRRLWLRFSAAPDIREYVDRLPDNVCEKYRQPELSVLRTVEYSNAAMGLWRALTYGVILAIEFLDKLEYLSDLAGIVGLVNSGEVATKELGKFRRKLYLELTTHLVAKKFGCEGPSTYRGHSTCSVISTIFDRGCRQKQDIEQIREAIMHVQACSITSSDVALLTSIQLNSGVLGEQSELFIPSMESVIEYISMDYELHNHLVNLSADINNYNPHAEKFDLF